MNELQKSIASSISNIVSQQGRALSLLETLASDMIAKPKAKAIAKPKAKAIAKPKAKAKAIAKPKAKAHCHGITVVGNPCSVPPKHGTDLCFFHSPRKAKAIAKPKAKAIAKPKAKAAKRYNHDKLYVQTARRWVYVDKLVARLNSGDFNTLTLDIANYQGQRLVKALYRNGWVSRHIGNNVYTLTHAVYTSKYRLSYHADEKVIWHQG